MKDLSQIKRDLSNNGYSWAPAYKSILQNVWSQMETYFDEDESVLSALWCSFKRYEDQMIGIVFITTKRTFTLECVDNSENVKVRYLPFDTYSLEKIKFQPSATDKGLNYVSLQNDAFGNGITFGTPNRKVAEHFIETLSGKISAEILILPDSDKPLLANNEKEQLVDENANKAKEDIPHKFQKKHEDEVKVRDEKLWHKQDPFMEKELEIKPIIPKQVKIAKTKNSGYGSKRNSYIWILWILLPIAIILAILLVVFLV